jgi:fluoride exporter
MKWLLIACGGFLGAIARYGIGVAVGPTRWPYATFVINVSGSLAIGFFLTLASERLIIHERWRFFFPIGFVGAYTTFSTYEYETLRLIDAGRIGSALSYVGASTVVGLLAVWLGALAARRIGNVVPSAKESHARQGQGQEADGVGQ